MNHQFVEKVKNSRLALKDIILNTPLNYAPNLSQLLDTNVYLKKENLQKTGSFKIRGAFNKIRSLTNEQKQKGVIASSAGNHAQGVAFSTHHFGIMATIVMPESTPITKVNGVKTYGAKVVLHGNNYDEAYERAIQLAKEQELTFIHPFDDDDVIAGQGTIALEILEQLQDIAIDKIIIPVGGGGLISGIAQTIKTINPKIQIIGVNAVGASAMRQSYLAGKPVHTKSVKTIADGIAVRKANEHTYSHIKKYVDEIVEVDDDEIAYAILFLLEQQKVLTEGAGAVSVASLLAGKVSHKKDENIVCLLSGGNIDVTMLSVIIEKGLLSSGRVMQLVVTLIDKPGSLTTLTETLKTQKANIVHISYDRTSVHLDYGDANVSVHLETKGKKHQEKILASLHEAGFTTKVTE